MNLCLLVAAMLPLAGAVDAASKPPREQATTGSVCPAPRPLLEDAGQDTELSADSVETSSGGDHHFNGEVNLRRGRELLTSDQAIYNKFNRELTLPGAFLWQDPELRLEGDRGTIKLSEPAAGAEAFALETAEVEQVKYELHGGRAHGSAEKLIIASESLQMHDASYSSCPRQAGTAPWRLHGGKVNIDRNSDEVVVEDAVLRVFGVPVLYAPKLTLSSGNRRHSGLLPPRLRNSSHTGIDISFPYYFNLAPERDATLVLRPTAKAGLLLGGEYRQLFADNDGGGRISGEYVAAAAGAAKGRGRIELDIDKYFTPKLELTVRADRVSDIRYFDDYGGGDNLQPVLQQQAKLSWRTDHGFALDLVADGWQSLRALPQQAKPYRRLPQLSWWYDLDMSDYASIGVDGGYAYFDRDSGVVGSRFNVSPWVRLRWHEAGRSIQSTVAMHATGYDLRRAGNGDQKPWRVLPLIDVVSSAHLASWRLPNSGISWHMLGLRMAYRYVPHRRQSHLPLFDTVPLGLSRSSLWYGGRYTGIDRIGDEHSVTIGLEHRFHQGAGHLQGRYSIGQRLYLGNPRVGLAEESRSGSLGRALLVQELSLQPYENMEIAADLLLDNERGNTERYQLRLSWNPPEDDNLFALWHSYRRELAENVQSGLELSLPLGDNHAWRWHLGGRFAWRGEADGLASLATGLEYKSCCWQVGLGVRRYRRSGRGHDTALTFDVQILGLSSLSER